MDQDLSTSPIKPKPHPNASILVSMRAIGQCWRGHHKYQTKDHSPPRHLPRSNSKTLEYNTITKHRYLNHNLVSPRLCLNSILLFLNSNLNSKLNPPQLKMLCMRHNPHLCHNQPTKKGRKGKTTTVQDRTLNWSNDELVCLADAWCLTSKDSIKCNDQKKTRIGRNFV